MHALASNLLPEASRVSTIASLLGSLESAVLTFLIRSALAPTAPKIDKNRVFLTDPTGDSGRLRSGCSESSSSMLCKTGVCGLYGPISANHIDLTDPDSTAPAEAVFAQEVKKLQADQFRSSEQLEPFERDHACVGGAYCVPKKQKVVAAAL